MFIVILLIAIIFIQLIALKELQEITQYIEYRYRTEEFEHINIKKTKGKSKK